MCAISLRNTLRWRIENRTSVKEAQGLLGCDVAEYPQPLIRLQELDDVGVLTAVGQDIRELVGHLIEFGFVENGAGFRREQGDVENVLFD